MQLEEGQGLRKLTSYLFAVLLVGASQAVLAATYSRLQQPGITVVVEGDAETAKNVAAMTFRLQSTARWLFGWPDSYREPPILIFVVNERLLDDVFAKPPIPIGAYTDATTSHGSWARTPALAVVVVPMGMETGHELRPLQQMYAQAVLRGEPARDWPVCANRGLSTLFSAVDLTPPNHLFLAGGKVPLYEHLWELKKILAPNGAPPASTPQYVIDEWGSSCYALAFLMASATPERRSALERMLTAVGKGTPLEIATQSELNQTLPEFNARYLEFARSDRMVPPIGHDLSVDLPGEIPALAAPVAATPDEVRTLMKQLCDKLHNCRK